jgi:hypothetical protein
MNFIKSILFNHPIQYIHLIIVSAMFMTFSCKKKNIVNPIQNIDLITSGSQKTWLLSDITTNGKSIMAACGKDDQYIFDKTIMKITYIPNTKCFNNDELKILNFKMNVDNKSITIDELEYVLETLTSNKMVISNDGHADGSRLNTTTSILHQQQTLTFIVK